MSLDPNPYTTIRAYKTSRDNLEYLAKKNHRSMMQELEVLLKEALARFKRRKENKG